MKITNPGGSNYSTTTDKPTPLKSDFSNISQDLQKLGKDLSLLTDNPNDLTLNKLTKIIKDAVVDGRQLVMDAKSLTDDSLNLIDNLQTAVNNNDRLPPELKDKINNSLATVKIALLDVDKVLNATSLQLEKIDPATIDEISEAIATYGPEVMNGLNELSDACTQLIASIDDVQAIIKQLTSLVGAVVPEASKLTDSLVIMDNRLEQLKKILQFVDKNSTMLADKLQQFLA